MPKTWKQYKKEVCLTCGNQMGAHKVDTGSYQNYIQNGVTGPVYRKLRASDCLFRKKGMFGPDVMHAELLCPKRIKWEAKRKAYAFKNDRVFTIFRMYYDGRKARNLGYGPMTEEECQAHCRDPKTKKAGVYFDGYDSI